MPLKFLTAVSQRPGVQFRQETIISIDPVLKIVTTRNRVYEADVLVIALGADYDISATPGLAECGNEYYSFDRRRETEESDSHILQKDMPLWEYVAHHSNVRRHPAKPL